MGTARSYLGGCGLQTAGLAVGGSIGASKQNITEEYDGASWTAGGTMNTARNAVAVAGIQTAALAFGGQVPPETGATEEYNGATWTSNPTGLNTARRDSGGVGIQTEALVFGGYTGTVYSNATEEWTGPGALITKTITVS